MTLPHLYINNDAAFIFYYTTESHINHCFTILLFMSHNGILTVMPYIRNGEIILDIIEIAPKMQPNILKCFNGINIIFCLF